MRCADCENWKTREITKYADGSEIVNWLVPEGKGRCSILIMETAAEFGCTSFVEELAGQMINPHVIRNWKNGAPWQHCVAGPCPECQGKPGANGGVCSRCAGTGKVRYYDDGYIGEEQTRLHPKERETIAPLKCQHCGELVDVKWKACPICGNRLEPVAETEHVGGLGNAGGDFRSDAKAQRAADLKKDIDAMNEAAR